MVVVLVIAHALSSVTCTPTTTARVLIIYIFIIYGEFFVASAVDLSQVHAKGFLLFSKLAGVISDLVNVRSCY